MGDPDHAKRTPSLVSLDDPAFAEPCYYSIRTKDSDFGLKPFSLTEQRCFDICAKSRSIFWMDSIPDCGKTAEHACARGHVGVKRIKPPHDIPHDVPLKADHGNRA